MGLPFDSLYELTGNATDNEVPSRATIKVITARVRKATYMRADGFHSGGWVFTVDLEAINREMSPLR